MKIKNLPPKYFKENMPENMKVTKLSDVGIRGNYKYKWLCLNDWSGWVRNPIVYKNNILKTSIEKVLSWTTEPDKVSIKLFNGVHIYYNNQKSVVYGVDYFLNKIGFRDSYIEIIEIDCFSDNNYLFISIFYAKQLAS